MTDKRIEEIEARHRDTMQFLIERNKKSPECHADRAYLLDRVKVLEEAEVAARVETWDEAIAAQCEFCGKGELAELLTWNGIARWWHGTPPGGVKCQAEYVRDASVEKLRARLKDPCSHPKQQAGQSRCPDCGELEC